MKELPVRKSIRLNNYDYSNTGYYFITICVKDRHELLWNEPVGTRIARPSLSGIGEVVEKAIENIHKIYEFVGIDKYVVMPNHIHMIITIRNDGRTQFAPTISRIIKQFKGLITKQIGFSIWQKSFHDHIIRDEAEYQRIWQYIDENSLTWEKYCYYV